jgi:hypothetical protein
LAKDLYHHNVKVALEKEGWVITDDPLTLKVGRRKVLIDLGAEQLIGAERQGCKIAVEIKSFLNLSPIHDLEQALGQFLLYSKVLEQKEPDRTLYLAVPQPIFDEIFTDEIGQILLNTTDLRLIFFEPNQEEISQWLPPIAILTS